MMDDFEANADGYRTIPNIAKLVVQSYVDMVLNPEVYDIDVVSKIDLSMLVADAAYANQTSPRANSSGLFATVT